MQLRIDIYEGQDRTPVIGHVFYGSKAQIESVIVAHMKTDSFFRAAMEGKKFRGMELTVRETWE
jgi:hypothetical protein